MTGDVKPRPYRSERRLEQAEQTRQRVLDAAALLFEQRGFERRQHRGDRRGGRRLGGDRLRPLSEQAQRCSASSCAVPSAAMTRGRFRSRTGPRAIAATTDQHEQLRLFASDIVLRLERAAPLVAIVADASRSEPELAELLARLHADRLKNLAHPRRRPRSATAPYACRQTNAVDTVWALTSPELHQLLVRIRGWTRRRYTDWLADSLDALLLP